MRFMFWIFLACFAQQFLAVRKQLGFTPQGLGLLVPLLFKGYFLCFMDATPARGNLNLEPVKSGCPD
jgi:hypothetical protein